MTRAPGDTIGESAAATPSAKAYAGQVVAFGRGTRWWCQAWTGCPGPGRDDYRQLISAGFLVPAVSVTGQLAADGGIELVSITVETRWPPQDPRARPTLTPIPLGPTRSIIVRP